MREYIYIPSFVQVCTYRRREVGAFGYGEEKGEGRRSVKSRPKWERGDFAEKTRRRRAGWKRKHERYMQDKGKVFWSIFNYKNVKNLFRLITSLFTVPFFYLLTKNDNTKVRSFLDLEARVSPVCVKKEREDGSGGANNPTSLLHTIHFWCCRCCWEGFFPFLTLADVALRFCRHGREGFANRSKEMCIKT